jgi:hypothetical protein
MTKVKLIEKVATYILAVVLVCFMALGCGVVAFCCILSPALLCLTPFMICFFLGGAMALTESKLEVVEVLAMVGFLLIGAGIAILVSGWLAPITFVPAVCAGVCVCMLCCQQLCHLPHSISSAAEEIEAQDEETGAPRNVQNDFVMEEGGSELPPPSKMSGCEGGSEEPPSEESDAPPGALEDED